MESRGASMVREGFEVEFECGHKAAYDKHSQHGIPELGQLGRCHRCDEQPEPIRVFYVADFAGKVAATRTSGRDLSERITQIAADAPHAMARRRARCA